MAGRPTSAGEDTPVDEQAIKKQLLVYQVALHRANEASDGSVEAARRVAVLQEKVWNQQSLAFMLGTDSDSKEAALASREAARHGELAVKLSRSTLADRVSELEQQVGLARSAGAGIRAEAIRRRAAANKVSDNVLPN